MKACSCACAAADEAMTAEWTKIADQVIAAHDNDSTQLVGILLDIQDQIELHYIPKPVAYYLSDKLGLKITQIFDVISFYASIYCQPRAKYPIQICNSVVCRINDGDSLYANLCEALGIQAGEVTADRKFTIEKVPCFGACDIAPAARINGKVYGHLTSKERIMDMLKECE